MNLIGMISLITVMSGINNDYVKDSYLFLIVIGIIIYGIFTIIWLISAIMLIAESPCCSGSSKDPVFKQLNKIYPSTDPEYEDMTDSDKFWLHYYGT